MADTVFVDKQTLVEAAWLNDVNRATYHGESNFIQEGTGAVNRFAQDKQQESVSIYDFGAIANGVTNDAAAIQLALNTGKSVRVYGTPYLGTVNSGVILRLTADGQCIYFEDGATFIVNGNNGVANSAIAILNDGFSGCYLYNPRIISNGTILTSDVRDSPYGYVVQCTNNNVNNVGIINGYGNKLQALFQTVLPAYNNTYDVNGVYVDYTADTCFYGIGLSGTGNCVKGQVNAIDCHRGFIGYGINTMDLLVKHTYIALPLARLQQSTLSVGVLNGLAKDTYGIKLKYSVSGNASATTTRFLFEAIYFSTLGAPRPKMYDIEVDYNDRGMTAGLSLGFICTVDGVLQTTYTGSLFDRITLSGYASRPFDLTSQGAIGSPLTQSIKGWADMRGLGMGTVPTGINDPFNNYLFSKGAYPKEDSQRVWFPTVVGATTAGTASYSSQIGRFTLIGSRIYFDLNVAWSGHTGTGTLQISLPFQASADAISCFQIWTQTLTFTGQPVGFIQPGTGYAKIGQLASGGGVTFMTVQAAGTVNLSGFYETA